MVAVSWPCRVAQTRDGRFIVTPFAAQECACEGATLSAAAERTKEALREYLRREMETGAFIAPPMDSLDITDIQSGEIVG